MGEVNYFKNFNMGREIEIAGEFIYESMREMYSLKSFSEHFKINKILYNGAVGIERLQKILLCMFLINQTKDFDDLPKSLKAHKHIALHELIKKSVPDYKLKSNKIKLLEVFQDYSNQRRTSLWSRYCSGSTCYIACEEGCWKLHLRKTAEIRIPANFNSKEPDAKTQSSTGRYCSASFFQKEFP